MAFQNFLLALVRNYQESFRFCLRDFLAFTLKVFGCLELQLNPFGVEIRVCCKQVSSGAASVTSDTDPSKCCSLLSSPFWEVAVHTDPSHPACDIDANLPCFGAETGHLCFGSR